MDISAAQKLITHPIQQVQAIRMDSETIQLTWPKEYGRAHIYLRPITADKSKNTQIGTSTNGQLSVTLPQADNRCLFTIEQEEHGRIWYAAERFIDLEHSINFRDIGGYVTKSGRQVCWGQVYRSGELGDFSGKDWGAFERLDIRKVLDLRTSDELEKKGDNLPAHLASTYQHQPIYEQANRSRKWLKTLIFNRKKIEQLWLEDIYIGRFITARAKAFGDVVKEIANDAKRPSLVHCTAGKDRTGISIALLLHILGVPRENIIAEYTLSNRDYERLLDSIKKDRQRMALFGLQTKHLFPILTAQANVLTHTFNHIDQTYGSIDSYIRDACQINDEVCRHLSDTLTTSTHTTK